MQPRPCTAGGAGGQSAHVLSPPGELAQAGLQPQLRMEEEAEASVLLHSSNPCVRGEETGHLVLTLGVGGGTCAGA